MANLIEASPELGELVNQWTESYNGQRAFFINQSTLIYTCSSSLKLIDVEFKLTKTFVPDHVIKSKGTNGICLLTANPAIQRFAISDTQLISPNVYVYALVGDKPKEQCCIKNGATCEYLAIEFSNSEVMLTLAGIPDLKMIVWNWKTGDKIASLDLDPTLDSPVPEYVGFSPVNWRNLFVAYSTSDMSVWSIEYFDAKSQTGQFVEQANFRLPLTDRATPEPICLGEELNHDEYPLPGMSHITGLTEDKQTRRVAAQIDKLEHHLFGCMCWSASGDEFLVATKENYVFKYSMSQKSSQLILMPSDVPEDNKHKFNLSDNNYINRMYLHRQGLFVACSDGKIAVLNGGSLAKLSPRDQEASNRPIEVKRVIDAASLFISNMSFNTPFTHLLISTDRGIQLLDCNSFFSESELADQIVSLRIDQESLSLEESYGPLQLVVNFDSSPSVGITPLNLNTTAGSSDHFLVLKENGCVQVWSMKEKKIVKRVFLNDQCSILASHPSMPLAVVGTTSGSLFFLDFSKREQGDEQKVEWPRILEKCALHKSKRVKILKFNSTGTLLQSVGDDNKLFLIDVRLSASHQSASLANFANQRLQSDYNSKATSFQPGFYVLGFLDLEAPNSPNSEVVCMDSFDYVIPNSSEKSISTRIVLGIHDPTVWENTIRKGLNEMTLEFNKTAQKQQNQQQAGGENIAAGSATISNINVQHHNLVVQGAQTDSVIPRPPNPGLTNINTQPDYCNYYYQEDTETSVPLLPKSPHQQRPAVMKLACKVVAFDFNFSIFAETDKSKLYTSVKKFDLKDEVMSKVVAYSSYLFSDIVLTARNYVLAYADRFLLKMSLPEQSTSVSSSSDQPISAIKKQQAGKLVYMELNELVGIQDFGYGVLQRANNGQFVCTGGFDGTVSIRTTNDLKVHVIKSGAVHFVNGGVKQVKWSNDGSSLLVLGYDYTVSLFNWNCMNESLIRVAKSYGVEVGGNVPDRSQLSKLAANYRPADHSSHSLTWYELRENEFYYEQDKQFQPIRREIISQLEVVQQKLQELMSTNAERDDLAKLKEHEFYLDLDELERLNKESDIEILGIRDKNDFDNHAKLFVRDKIKKECWDEMKVKGRGISAFNSNLLVENYPLKERSREEMEKLDSVIAMRRIEMAAQKTRSELTSEIMKKDNINEIAELTNEDENEVNILPSGGAKADDKTNAGQQAQQQQHNNYTNPNLTQLAFKGSLAPLFNGDSQYFYHQFELFTREQKWMQIVIIQDCIYRVKENFNKEFEQVMQRKQQEIAKIREKNQRLKQIFVDLDDPDRQITEAQFGIAEQPELLFEVKDSEIKVEKYLTPEQRRLLEEQLAEEARRRELERLDNWRERGLMDMMGGVLQIRREDELKKDIPVPAFVIEKPQKEEWTLDEQRQYAVYEQKVKELNEERDKLRKQLNAEIIKINEQIADCYQNFDNILLGLHLRKVKTQQAVYQEELKILRLFNSMMVDAELELYENQLNQKLEALKEKKKSLTQENQQLRKQIDASREEYDILQAEDKAQEKVFLREFSDVSLGIRDQLLKLFKKRPRQRGPNLGKTFQAAPNQAAAAGGLAELGEDTNPFAFRPSTAQQLQAYEDDIADQMAEWDKYEGNAPPGVDSFVWDRFVEFRRQKIEQFENKLRAKSLALAEQDYFMQKRAEEDEQVKAKIERLTKEAASVQDLRLRAHHNLQIQLLMKQGQVEIDANANVHNFENFLLIHRSVVESLNKIITGHGNQKIATMKDSKDLRKGITLLEWEHKRMKMTIEDYITKQRDITYLKLTREIQEYLNSVDYDGKKMKEIATLEQTLTYQAEQHKKQVEQKHRHAKEIRKQATRVANSNDQYDDKLQEQNIALFERKHISQDMTGKSINVIREERFSQIIQRRKLVDLAKAQAQEVAFLRSEVERLRMKTFPALVQIEY